MSRRDRSGDFIMALIAQPTNEEHMKETINMVKTKRGWLPVDSARANTERIARNDAKMKLRQGDDITGEQARALLAGIIDNDYESLRECAKKWKVSPAYLSDVRSGRREPGPAILNKLGLRKVVTVGYRVP